MKKTGAILIAVALVLLTGFALAETSLVARNGALSAYIDGEGRLYLPGNESPINTAGANALVAIDPYRVLFKSDRDDGKCDLYMIDLGSFSERLVAEDVRDAALPDESTLYYVSGTDRSTLRRVNLADMTVETAYTAAEPIDRLYSAAEGLVFSRADGAGTLIYNKLTGSFDSYLGALPEQGMMTDSTELYLTDGELYMRDLSSLVSEHIDSGVRDFAALNGGVYYLCENAGVARLKYYDPAAMTWQVVLTLEPQMERQLTASAGALFLLDDDNKIYTVDAEAGELRNFTELKDLSGYSLPAGYGIGGIRLEAMSGQLNVYAELEDTTAQPSFSFIEFTSDSDSEEPNVRLIERFAVENEETAWAQLKPAEQYAPLSRGSRGEAVRAIQRPLYDLGYYDYYVDGIFGPRTQFAVRLLQSDLERSVTGVADSELQHLLLSGGLPHYDAYLALTRGNRGLRVQIMQEKLRDLGYLADAADGIFGANTQRAVQLFQSENGLAISDGATRETLKKLYSDAARCTSFIDLYPGYTGCRVRELNDRLQALYYLEDNPGTSYTLATAEAVREFQRTAGLTVNGSATTDVLRRLFSGYAPEAPGYSTLRRGDENTRVEALQQRLKALNYYSGSVDGYFGKATEKAVKLFQKKMGLSATGIATVRTQALLFSSTAPVYVKPTVIGEPSITVERYDVVQDGVYYIGDDGLSGSYASFSWSAEGEVKEYGVKVEDASGGVLLNEKTLLTRTGVALSALKPDNIYTLTITAYPEDGSKKHITSDSVRFVRCRSLPVPPPPAIGDVEAPEILLTTVLRAQGGVQYVQPGTLELRWHADGEVDKYYIEIMNDNGDVLLNTETRDEQAVIQTSSLSLGQSYTMFVYAIPTNGTLENAAAAAEHFALEDVSVPTPTPEPVELDITPEPIVTVAPTATPEPTVTPEPTAVPEPTTTPEPTAEPVVEEPVVEEPAIEEPVVEEPVVEESEIEEPEIEEPEIEEPEFEEPEIEEPEFEEPAIEEPEIEEPEFEEPVIEEPAIEEPEIEEPEFEEPVIEEPAIEEPEFEEPVIEEPVTEEPEFEEPAIEEPVIEEPYDEVFGETTVAMDPETSAQVQSVLVDWGWLAEGSYEPGMADEPTLLAIGEFEAYYNAAYSGMLASADGQVDVNTLALLLDPEGTSYPKPEPIE